MKKISCSVIGGPADCTTTITGETAQEMIMNGWNHIEAEHSQLASDIKGNPKDVNDKWMAEFTEKFDSLEDA